MWSRLLWTIIAISAVLVVTPFARFARAVDGPPAVLRLHDQVLVLNGYGEREHWWTDIYRCALYLPKRTTALPVIRDPATAKAIRVRVLYGDLPQAMPADWRRVFAEELNRELMGRLKRVFRKLDQNDRITFSYHPGRGSEVWVNGERILVDPGHDLMLGLVDQWLGKRPVSKNLKRLLLSNAG